MITKRKARKYRRCLMSLQITGFFLYQKIIYFIALKMNIFELSIFIMRKRILCGSCLVLIPLHRKRLIIGRNRMRGGLFYALLVFLILICCNYSDPISISLKLHLDVASRQRNCHTYSRSCKHDSCMLCRLPWP